MKFAITVAVTIATLAGLPLLAQDSNTDPNAGPSTSDSAKVTYAPAAGGFGDLAASHAWEMSAVTGELEGKLDSKTAKVGDRVVLKTTDKVQTSGRHGDSERFAAGGPHNRSAGIRPATRAGTHRDCVRSRGIEERAEHFRLHIDPWSEPERHGRDRETR